MNFRTFVQILHDHGFELDRQRGSHRVYKGVIDGQVRLVVVAGHRDSDDIKPGTLASMIRQSGLPRKLFR
jgi:predicted RNA binding protein YcfA (HicA-like mRNA interferase family)